MKTIPQWFKTNRLIALCVIMLTLLSSTDSVFSQENSMAVLEPPLNPAYARENLQTSYAIKIAQLTINAINAYKDKYQKTPSEKQVNWFTEELLRNDEDQLIQVVKYVPDESLTIIMQDNRFVAPLLRGTRMELSYEKGRWKTKQELPTVAATSPELLRRDIGMGLVTDYCKWPQENFGFPGMWRDTEWCLAWLEHVMSLLQ